jgi:hypothetical protein
MRNLVQSKKIRKSEDPFASLDQEEGFESWDKDVHECPSVGDGHKCINEATDPNASSMPNW